VGTSRDSIISDQLWLFLRPQHRSSENSELSVALIASSLPGQVEVRCFYLVVKLNCDQAMDYGAHGTREKAPVLISFNSVRLCPPNDRF